MLAMSPTWATGSAGLTGPRADRADRLAGFLGSYQDALGFIDAYTRGLATGGRGDRERHHSFAQRHLELPGTGG